MENPGYVVYPDDMEENKLQPSQTESNPRLESKETPLQQSGGDCSTVAENNAVKKKTTKSETETPIDLQQSSSTTADDATCPDCGEGLKTKKREPRLIYCRDGVITEDEVGKLFDEFDEPLSKSVSKWTEGMVPSECSWPKWLFFYSIFIFVNIIIVCEYLGEKLARFFGIMDSKYTYILEEHYRNIKRQKEIEDSLAMEPEISLTNVRQIDPENIETTSNEK